MDDRTWFPEVTHDSVVEWVNHGRENKHVDAQTFALMCSIAQQTIATLDLHETMYNIHDRLCELKLNR